MLPWLREKFVTRRQRWLRTRNEENKPQLSEIQDDTGVDFTNTSELLNLKIVAPKLCIILNLQVSYFDTCLQIKEKLLKKLESNQSPSRTVPNDIHSFRLIRSCTKELFQNFDSILNSNVVNNEEFILIIRRTDGHMNQMLNVQNQQHGPTDREILNRTKHFPIVHSTISAALNMTLDSQFFQGDLQHDLRKILSEIAKYSAYILGCLPYAEKLIRYYRQKILYNLNNHSDIVKILSEMGFSRKSVIRALRLQGNNYTLALDWLVENVSKEEDIEEEGGQSTYCNMELSSESNEIDDDSSGSDTYKKFYTKPYSSSNSIFYPQYKAISIKDRVEGLLEIVKYYSEKNEEPSTKADTINSLINMGFAMDEIERALQMTSNNQMAACEWLLENSSNSQNTNALRESIFVESHILKILLSTPQIQFSLSSPKFFIAFISLLENYSSLNIFFNDLESHSLLQFILRTYHEEKIFYHTFDKLTTTSATHPSSSS